MPLGSDCLWQTIFVHQYCHRSWSLRIYYVTQLSILQQTLRELWQVTPDPVSKIGLIARSAKCSLHHHWRLHVVGFSDSRKRLSSAINKQKSYVTLLNLKTSNNPKMDWYNSMYLNYGHNVTFNSDYVLTWFNDYFALHLWLYNGICF